MDITKTKKHLLICLMAFAMCSIFTAKTFGQTVRRVDNSVTTSGNGQTWAGAYKNLWEALAEANNPNPVYWEIWVAQGTYTPVLFDSPFIINGKTGAINDRIVLLGGFAGLAVPANSDQRDPKLYPTILSGDIGGVAGNMGEADGPFPDGIGALSDSTRFDNAVNVLLVTNSGRGNRIEGFTIQGGIGGEEIEGEPYNIGGGIIIKDSALDIVNCTFRLNSAGATADPNNPSDTGRFGEGGAAFVIGSSEISAGIYDYTRFINCIFYFNFASRGGALALVDGSKAIRPTQVKVINCQSYNNRSFDMSEAVLKPGDDNDRFVRLPVEDQSP